MPDGSFRYENITAGSRHRKFPSGRADWMERKTPPSSDVFLEKGQIPGIFPSPATPQSFLQVSWVPSPQSQMGPFLGAGDGPPPPGHGTTGQGCGIDGWTDSLGMLSWDSCSPRAGAGCSGRFMGGSCPWEKNQGVGGDQNRQKPALPQPKCLDVRHQGLVQKPWACCSNQAALLFLLGFSSQNRLILV